MSGPALVGVAVGLVVVSAATVVLWLDRRGRGSLIRTGGVALLAGTAVAGLGASGVRDLAWSWGEYEAASALLAAVWVAGLAMGLAVAGLLGWLEAPVEGVALGAVAGAAAGAGLAVAVDQPEVVTLAALQVGWQTAAGALVGGGVSLAGLQPVAWSRIAGGAGALAGGWVLGGGLLWGQSIASHGLAGQPLLAVGAGLLAVAAVVAVAALAHRCEAGILLRELTEEVGFGIIPPAVAQVVTRLPSRLRAHWWPRADERRWLAATLTQLALCKHRLRRGRGPKTTLDGLQIGRIRTRLRVSWGSHPAGGDEGPSGAPPAKGRSL